MDSFCIEAAIAYYHFKINHSKTKDMSIGKWITSPKFQVGQHYWTIKFFPKGKIKKDSGKYVSVFLEHCRESVDVDKHGNSAGTTMKQSSHIFTSHEVNSGFTRFIERTKLEEMYVKDDCFVLVITLGVKNESCDALFPIHHFANLFDHPPIIGNASSTNPLTFPRKRIQKFREENKQTDVTFDVDGKKFVAHRVILAAHSPIFEAEFIGSITESNLDCITIKEMMPSVFKAMLDFMYNGSLSVNDELIDDDGPMLPISFLQNLLVAADRYAVELLKHLCEHRLADCISLDTVVSFLEVAEKHNCGVLKNACLRFVFDKEKSFLLMFDEGYIKLMQNYPSLLAELKERASK